MSFVTFAALAVALLVGAPVAAHMLRRRQAEERLFSAVHLVPATPPLARRRSRLEDRGLFALRALAILALAALGATPLVTCSRLSIARPAGASVALAIVLDDSLSMRAPVDGGAARPGAKTRFDRAVEGARDLVAGARQGDAVALVLAGAPPRVLLASTTSLGAVSAALDGVSVSDRATDLEAAIRMARELSKALPQTDRRVVVLSDLADGAPDRPLEEDASIVTWVPLPELAASGADCAVVRADRAGHKVHARVVCSAQRAPGDGPMPPSPSADRRVEVRAGDVVLGTAALGPAVRAEDVTIEIPADAGQDLVAALTGTDSIAEDDSAPVVATGGSLAVAVIADAAGSQVETGGAPPIEQAFAALGLDADVRPLPTVPEHPDELDALAALVIDDAPGFTPEGRRSLAAWVDRGGVVLLTLGPRAAVAPLGAGFDPLVPGVVRWGDTPSRGIDPAGAGIFGASAEGLRDLAPRGRASLDPEATDGAVTLAAWSDGAPLLLERPRGRGVTLTLTLPLGTSQSDLALRPAFLLLLDRLVDTARARGGARRIDAGDAWAFDGYAKVTVESQPRGTGGVAHAVAVTSEAGRLRAVPPLAGTYRLKLDGDAVTRAVAVPEREIDLRPRAIAPGAQSEALGGVAGAVDASPHIALLLLGLLAAELAVRALGRGVGARRVDPSAPG